MITVAQTTAAWTEDPSLLMDGTSEYQPAREASVRNFDRNPKSKSPGAPTTSSPRSRSCKPTRLASSD
jgi:hypothetical protein